MLGGLLDTQPGSHRRAQIGLQVASLDLQAKLQHPGVQVGSEEMTIGRAPEHGVYRADPSQGLAAELASAIGASLTAAGSARGC